MASRREIAAQILGMDFQEIKDYQYNAGHTRTPVYAVGEQYIMVGNGAEAKAVSAKLDREFIPHTDDFWQKVAAKSGWQVWEFTNA